MSEGELSLVRWMARVTRGVSERVEIGIGDDMAAIRIGDRSVLITTDMLLDGVHFRMSADSLDQIGHKAIAAGLSDCAGMAARPLAATVSVALPETMSMDQAKGLFTAMHETARRYGCDLVGGDTTSWSNPLAVDVTMLAEPALSQGPVRRSTARPGDTLYVTGPLGGSLSGRHLFFSPRLDLLDFLADLGPALHAMMDISDGLALDLHRMGEASGLGAELEDDRLRENIHQDVYALADQDGAPLLDHVLHDGEDFELLLAVAPNAEVDPARARPVGRMIPEGFVRIDAQGARSMLTPRGYEHFRRS